MDASDSMQPVTRIVDSAERGVCKAIDHRIIYIGRISSFVHSYEAIDKYYCPTCNKTWEETYGL
jgi:hypothetical protein